MKLQRFVQDLFTPTPVREWIGQRPHAKFEKKLNSILPETVSEDAEFVMIDFSVLGELIDSDVISRDYERFNNGICKTGTFRQTVTPVTKKDYPLIEEAMKGRRVHEVLKLTIITASGNNLSSEYIHGEEHIVGHIKDIEWWINSSIFELRKQGETVKSVQIDHVHPTLEVLAITDAKSTTITNGLSQSDYAVAQRVGDRIPYPVTVSAIVPSGLKYSVTLNQ